MAAVVLGSLIVPVGATRIKNAPPPRIQEPREVLGKEDCPGRAQRRNLALPSRRPAIRTDTRQAQGRAWYRAQPIAGVRHRMRRHSRDNGRALGAPSTP